MPIKFLMPKLITQYDKSADRHYEIVAWDVFHQTWYFMIYSRGVDRFCRNGNIGNFGVPSHFFSKREWDYMASHILDGDYLYKYLPLSKRTDLKLPPDVDVIYEL